MRAPLSWIRDFTPADAPVDDIAHALSFLGLVVEGTEQVAAPWPGIVVARVLETRPHPAADRIQLVDVDAGDGEALQICCGAFNMRSGDMVPLATLGTKMPSGIEIARRKMRGEWSNGMLCSAPELGVGLEGPAPAIFVLPSDVAAPGTPLAEAFGLGPDVVFDLEVSPNRPDCFSIAGIARDLAAALGETFRPLVTVHSEVEGIEAAQVSVDADAVELCPRFTGTVVQNVDRAAVSPLVSRRVALAGMRPISAVVDASNYVMLELGQPNHPYDLDELGGRALQVRRAAEGEEMVTLDGVARHLGPDDLVIADGAGRAVGVAGIMGGASAGITPATATVLLEVATFLPGAISATGKRLGLLSEARARFERGVDPQLPLAAVDRFVDLLGPGVRRGATTDRCFAAVEPCTVKLRTSRVNLLLGTSLAPGRPAELLSPLGFEASPLPAGGGDGGAPDAQDFKVPTWRPDCTREVDLIEEVARVYGYAKLARRLPHRPMRASGLTAYQRGRRRVRRVLTGAGADEAWTSTFLSAADFARAGLGEGGVIELENPLDSSESLLRTSLLPGLLKAARFNVERQAGALALWEIGSVFGQPGPEQRGGPLEWVAEREELALVAIGQGAGAEHAAQLWEVLASGLRVGGAELRALPATTTATAAEGEGEAPAMLLAAPALHHGRRAAIVVGGHVIGLLGELAPEVAARHDLPGRVSVLTADLSGLLATSLLFGAGHLPSARQVSKYPASDLDMAFAVDSSVPAGAVEATVRDAAGALAEAVALFDVWRGQSLGDGKRSLAFRVRLRAPDRTLTEAEIAQVRHHIAAAVQVSHGGALRDS